MDTAERALSNCASAPIKKTNIPDRSRLKVEHTPFVTRVTDPRTGRTRVLPHGAPITSPGALPASIDTHAFVSLNTAIGAKPKLAAQGLTPVEERVLELKHLEDVRAARLHAPTVGLQEVGEEQLRHLRREARRTGSFQVFSLPRPGFKPQHLALLVPKRYDVLSHGGCNFVGAQLEGGGELLWKYLEGELEHAGDEIVHEAKSLWASIWGSPPPEPLPPNQNALDSQIVEPRGVVWAHLYDPLSKKDFVVLNTHLSGHWKVLRPRQAYALAKLLRAAGEHSPVVLLGDLNMRSAESRPPRHSPATKSDIKALEALGLGPDGELRDIAAPTPYPGKRIDVIAVSRQFEGKRAESLDNAGMGMPPGNGSDHNQQYAEAKLPPGSAVPQTDLPPPKPFNGGVEQTAPSAAPDVPRSAATPSSAPRFPFGRVPTAQMQPVTRRMLWEAQRSVPPVRAPRRSGY